MFGAVILFMHHINCVWFLCVFSSVLITVHVCARIWCMCTCMSLWMTDVSPETSAQCGAVMSPCAVVAGVTRIRKKQNEII